MPKELEADGRGKGARRAAAGRSIARPEQHQRVGIRVGQRTEDETIDGAENGNVDTDAEHEREDGADREPPCGHERPDGVVHVGGNAVRRQRPTHGHADPEQLHDQPLRATTVQARLVHQIVGHIVAPVGGNDGPGERDVPGADHRSSPLGVRMIVPAANRSTARFAARTAAMPGGFRRK